MASIYLRGRIWWCSYRDCDGHRRRESTGTRNRQWALQTVTRREQLHWMVAEGFLDREQLRIHGRGKTELTDKTIKDRTGPFVQKFIDAAKLRTANDFSSGGVVRQLEKWMRQQHEVDGLAARTVNRKLWQVQAFGDWLVRDEYISVNATKRVQPLRESGEDRKMPHRAFTPQEAERLIAGAPARYRLFYRFQLWTGLRSSEARLIERRDLDLGDKPAVTVRAAVAKNGHECTIPLAKNLAEALAPLAMKQGQVFSHLHESDNARYKELRRHLTALGFPAEVNGRSFRMSFVTWLLAAGVELGVAMRLRRDLGKGSERLTSHTYNDPRQTAHLLRDGMAQFEAWYVSQIRAGRDLQATGRAV